MNVIVCSLAFSNKILLISNFTKGPNTVYPIVMELNGSAPLTRSGPPFQSQDMDEILRRTVDFAISQTVIPGKDFQVLMSSFKPSDWFMDVVKKLLDESLPFQPESLPH